MNLSAGGTAVAPPQTAFDLLPFLPPMGTPTGEFFRALVIGGAYLLVFLAAELALRWAPPREWTRKFVHVAGGLLAATLPWVLGSHWTVLILGCGLAALLWGTRRIGWLSSVHGVRRRTEGGLYFPLAIYLLFLLGAGRPVFYLTSVLVLVVADTAAAILGRSYGRTTYEVEEDRRSIEGSTVFFLMAFLSIHLPLLLLTELDRGAVVLIALQLALLVTFFEAISLRGIDNLLVPLGTLYLLVKLTPQGADEIARQLAAQLAIVSVIALVAWRYRFLTFSGALALILFFYGAWALGGPEWIIAPTLAMFGFVAFRRWLRVSAEIPDARYQVLALVHVGIVAAALFVVNNTFETLLTPPSGWERLGTGDPLHTLFVGAVAAQLGLLYWVLVDQARFEARRRRLLVAGALTGAFLLVVPAGVLTGPGGWVPGVELAIAGGMMGLSGLIFLLARRRASEPLSGLGILRAQTISVGLATLAVLPLQLRHIGVL